MVKNNKKFPSCVIPIKIVRSYSMTNESLIVWTYKYTALFASAIFGFLNVT